MTGPGKADAPFSGMVPRHHGTQVFRLPPEPPVGTTVVACPDYGGPYWERDDLHPILRWRQSKSGDHRNVTWAEVLFEARGAVQVLPERGGAV